MELKIYRCDLCYELLYIPERSLHKLEVDRETNGVLDWELCSGCYDKFLAWIKHRQEQQEEKES